MKKAKSNTSKSGSVSKCFPLKMFFSTQSTVNDVSTITNDKSPIAKDFQASNSEHNVNGESDTFAPCSSSMLLNLQSEMGDNTNDDNDNLDFELSHFEIITNTTSHREITGNNTMLVITQ